MLIRQFLLWAERANAGARAEATSALARAFLYGDLDPIDLGDAERALTSLLDDPSPLVRRALAEAFATSVEAPHHLVVALAADQSDIAAIVLERSPVLGDAELIDVVAVGDEAAQCAVARRPRLPASLAGALAEVGSCGAALALCDNIGAELTEFAAERLIQRFGHDADIRESLGRRDLGPQTRHALVVATGMALSDFVTRCRWMTPERAKRVLGEARDRATISIATDRAAIDDESCQRRFAAYLQSSGYLTPAIVLRALLSGNRSLFEAALCELTGRDAARVAGLVRNQNGLGFAALYRSAGFPDSLLPAFRAAVAASLECRTAREPQGEARLHRGMVERVIAACADLAGDELARLSALLRRFEAEAARDDARSQLDELVVKPPVAPAWQRFEASGHLAPALQVAA